MDVASCSVFCSPSVGGFLPVSDARSLRYRHADFEQLDRETELRKNRNPDPTAEVRLALQVEYHTIILNVFDCHPCGFRTLVYGC